MTKMNKLLSGVSIAALGMIAVAQQAQAQAPAAAVSVEEVVVTGSRIQGTFTTPTPVTAVTADQLAVAGPTTVAQGLQQLPSVSPGGGPTAGGGTANGGQNFLALRGLGAGRTLTLLDGRRFTPAGPAGTVDSNLIPSGLLQRVDVVTGGASAAYGSDAVAGVINFILDRSFEGIKVDAHVGRSEHNDNKDYKATFNMGKAYADGRGHVLFSAEYYDNDGVLGSAREFRRTASNQVLDPTKTDVYVRVNDLRTPYTTGGLIVIGAGGTAANNAAFQGIKFAPDGTSSAYDYGTFSSTRGTTFGTQNGGDGFRVSTGQEIIRPLQRKTVFINNDFQLTDAINVFTQVGYAATRSDFASSPTTHTLTIQRDNAYLARFAPEIQARMTTLGVPRLTMNRLTLERGPTHTDNLNYTLRGLAGLNGEIKGWRWEIAYQDGQNRNKGVTINNLLTPRMALAVDAVVNPANGAVVCRSTLTTPGNGCVPFNPFGAGAPSEQALAYVMGTESVSLTTTRQKGGDFSLSGSPFELPAGPLSVAVGGEWREMSARTRSDPFSNAGNFRLVNQQDFFGKYDIWEVFAEAQIPVLAEMPFIKSLDLNVAGRHTDYSTSGGVQTWKFGAVWDMNDEFRLRYTRSRDIRAPNLQELFATGRQNNIVVVDELTGRTFNAIPNRTFGNINLQPEVASTTVLGAVYRPQWFSGFSLAVDYYEIRIRDAIGNVGGNNAVTQCNRSGQTSPICAFVTRDPATRSVIATQTAPANLTVSKVSGVDFEASYRLPLADWFEQDLGTASVRSIFGYRSQNVTISPLVTPTINTAGEQGTPKWRGTVQVNHALGPVRTFVQARYIGKQIWDKERTLGVNTDFQDIEDAVYFDGQVAWEMKEGREIYLNVQNILDKDPVYSPSPGGATPTPTDTALYDQVGRMYRVGVRLRF
jgi:iron complex outermembrane recepter protein